MIAFIVNIIQKKNEVLQIDIHTGTMIKKYKLVE